MTKSWGSVVEFFVLGRFGWHFKGSAVLCEEEEEKAAEKGGKEGKGVKKGGKEEKQKEFQIEVAGGCLDLTCARRTLASRSVTWTTTGTTGW